MAVELAQPALLVGGPVVQVVECRFGKGVLAEPLAQGEQLVLERFGEVGLPDRSAIGFDECTMKERRDQRGVVGAQQPPRGMALAQALQGVEIEAHLGRAGRHVAPGL
ncbi:hypothetical protein D9M70_576840 [compost metagenome]